MTAIFLATGTIELVRADHVLEANGSGQNLVSIDRIYSTSTAQPAMLAKNGGTILSISDLVTVIPPGGLIGIEADGAGSRIVATNLRLEGLGLGVTSGVEASNGGFIELKDASITVGGQGGYALTSSGRGSAIDVFNSSIISTLRSGALVENGASLTLVDSSVTALIHGIVSTAGTFGAPKLDRSSRREREHRLW